MEDSGRDSKEKEAMKVYGVFCDNLLIFSNESTYAIYEKEDLAKDFMREMKSSLPGVDYTVHEIELNVKVAHGPTLKVEDIE